ncbi:MAG: hypothetical protein ACREAY_07925 [Nitrososphaera sp.]|uniref:hypothetical protein n=1 Tax=Nitrososphaera sp. TaxID=1971748 RepID=UPI003D6F32FC
MDYRFFTSSAIALMLALGIVAAAANAAYAQTDDRWYVGEGAKQDMFVKYRIQNLDTNNNDPFEMTVYFKEQDADGNWIAPTFVQYNGRVYSGTMKLGDNLASLGGGSDIPDDLRPFIGAYGRSLQWLEAFTAKSKPLSLSQPSWGKIGGEEITPMGNEQVKVQEGVYDSTIIGWHEGGRDNRVWVVNDFPYPVKAETYEEGASGNGPVKYKFSLLQEGTGQPDTPANLETPTPPLRKSTSSGTFSIDLDWEPRSIEPGKEVEFGFIFTNNQNLPIERVSYNFTVKDAGGNVLEERVNQFTDLSTGFQKFTFDEGGAKTVSIAINSESGQSAEAVDFGIVVVPEFPTSAAIIAALVIALAIAVTRFRGTSLGSIFGGRKAP